MNRSQKAAAKGDKKEIQQLRVLLNKKLQDPEVAKKAAQLLGRLVREPPKK